MKEKTLGILGGMGPEATVYFMRKIIELTPAERDQDHIRMIVVNDPKTPDRTAAILEGGENPVPVLIRNARLLEDAGADLIAVPCNSFFFFYEEVQRAISIPIIHMIEETAKVLDKAGIRRVGIVATKGTLKTRLYHNALGRRGIELIEPTDIEGIMRAIYEIKAGKKERARKKVLEALQELERKGAERVIAGCTEIPLVVSKEEYPIVDPMEIVAKIIIREIKGADLKLLD